MEWNAIKVAHNGNDTYIRAYRGDEFVWEKYKYWSDEPFWVENVNDFDVLFLGDSYYSWMGQKTNNGEYINGKILFSFDKTNWDDLYSFDYQGRITIPPHSKVWFINDSDFDLEHDRTNSYNLFNIVEFGEISGNTNNYAMYNIGGNFHSLIYNWNAKVVNLHNAYAFRMFFMRNRIIDASELVLPATTLTKYCYDEMFKQNYELKQPPKILPALTLAEYCYHEMFEYCYEIENSPILPALYGVKNCYENMFTYCQKIKKITCLLRNQTTVDCTRDWVRYDQRECGSLYIYPGAHWGNDSDSDVPRNWFIRNYC